MQYRLLVVDDDRALLEMLRVFLERRGYLVGLAPDGREALERLSAAPDLILLDINMPRMDGLEVCRRIRSAVDCPILFITGRTQEQDVVNGLLAGGDDYICKPFSLRELDARILSHLKREERGNRRTKVRLQGEMCIDFSGRRLSVMGTDIPLTRAEFAIVELLARHAGQVFDRERIYEIVCGLDAQGDSRVVTELIRRIRAKLREHTAAEYIETVWGCGYRWRR